jgi:hypothetical protein
MLTGVVTYVWFEETEERDLMTYFGAFGTSGLRRQLAERGWSEVGDSSQKSGLSRASVALIFH